MTGTKCPKMLSAVCISNTLGCVTVITVLDSKFVIRIKYKYLQRASSINIKYDIGIISVIFAEIICEHQILPLALGTQSISHLSCLPAESTWKSDSFPSEQTNRYWKKTFLE